MKKRLPAVIIIVLLMMSSAGAQHIKHDRLFKVDPASGLFKEFRVAVENRWKKSDFFWYVAPFGFRQTNLKDPDQPQKTVGFGVRGGLRKYFFTKFSPQGFYVHGGFGLRHLWFRTYGADLSLDQKTIIYLAGLHATAGYQRLYGPRKVKPRAFPNFAYGAMIGLEWYQQIGNDPIADLRQNNWYQISSGTFGFLNGFRLYLGVELGFAFKQKRLHW